EEHVKKEKLRTGLDEWLLFHGMNPSHVPAICEQNFNWRICGTHGTMHGKGTSIDASCSHRYCPSSTSYHSVFVALAVVGDFVHGNKAYLCPPPRPEISNRLLDSCVDDQKNPSIFVIFEKNQIYPAYILEYTCRVLSEVM
ncbi:PAR12 polymerase, partial [Asarcornis scutulata]|nr:PAR12 polymerase [Asarcornis scutulata]